MNRPLEGGTTFVTGGDVSRFQLKNVPPNPEQMARQIAARMPTPPTRGAQQAAAPSGPVVRVTRGKVTSEEPVGSR
jgi:pilus assembly protein CpaB